MEINLSSISRAVFFAVHSLLTGPASGPIVAHTRDRGLALRSRNQGGCHDRQEYFGRQTRRRRHDRTDRRYCRGGEAASERRIGAVVILGADNRIVGIFSERDIVRALAERGSTTLNEPVSQVMTRDVKTCSEDDSIGELMGRMTTGKFRHMPVVQQGKLIGIVSIGDVVKSRVEEIGHETTALREYIQTA